MIRVRSLVALFALMFSLQAVAAYAAPAPWRSVDVTVHSEQQQSLLLVSGELAPDVKLPAEAELAVPAGTQLQWIGEILGGDPSEDPEVKYTVSTSGGMDVYRFTLSTSRSAQVEGVIQNVTAFDGTAYATALKWTAWQPIPEVRVSQRIPQAATIVQQAEGATIQSADTGYAYYTKPYKSLKGGEVLDLTFSYALPAAGAATAGGKPATTGGGAAFWIVLAAAAGGLALLFYNVNRKMAAKAGAAEPATAQAARFERAVPVTADESEALPEEAVDLEGDPETEHSRARNPLKVIIPIVVVGIFVVGFIIAGSKGTTAAVANGQITRNFGAPSPCQSASVPFSANAGVDLTVQGDQLLKGFEGMEGVGVVTVDLAQSRIDMSWCESSQSEDSMRQVLAMTGLITLGDSSSAAVSAPATATVDASGGKQTISVDTASGSFAPNQLVLKAGVPAEIAFSAAAGCLTEVVIESLGVNQDLKAGPATVKLPALEPGTYEFACALGHQGGQIVVQ